MTERVPGPQVPSVRREPGRGTTARRGIRSPSPMRFLLAALAAVALVVFPLSSPAFAAPPSFVDPPTRLYMAPAGSLPVNIPDGFPTIIPEGDLPFDGETDLISGDVRTIEVESGEAGCAMAAPDWNQGGCTAVQLSVSHGTLTFDPLPTQEDDGDSPFDVLKFADGALERDKAELGDLPAPAVALIGTTAQVNAALATLVYLPDTDEDDDGTEDDPYFYNGSNPETLDITLAAGDPAIGNATTEVEIRVQRINEFPEVEVPDTVFQVPSGGTGFLGDAGSDVGEADEEDWNVVDVDNDEQDDNDTIDGPGDEWLLIAWADCGTISMPASPFTIYDDLEQLFEDALDLGLEPDPADPEYAEYQTNKTALIDAAMAALPDEVKNLPFATGIPSDPHSAFAGVVSGLNALDSLNYALDQVEFQATGLADVTCTVRFMVSDLGNNGLPLQYLGDAPYGIQVPFFGFDLDTNDFPTTEKVVVEVGEGETIEVALPTDVSVPEGGAATVPLTVSPATHPAFDLTISTTAVAPTSAADFSPIPAQTFTVPEDAASIDIPVDALQDGELDPGETYTVTIDGFPGVPPFPPGYDVTITDGSAVVAIDDDEVPVDTTPPTVTIEQGAAQVDPTGVSPIVFDVVFSEPVTGFGPPDVVLSGSAGPAAAVVSGAGASYTVEVSGMSANGLVIADVVAAGAEDAAGNLSEASTSVDNEVTFTGFDEVAPTVTIEQGAAQADPTSTLPIVFDVVFSEPVLGFADADVTVSSSGPGVPTAVVTPGAVAGEYTVEVSGLTGAGIVTASIGAGVVTDAALNANVASTSTDNSVAYEPFVATPPTVTIDQGATQVDPTSTLPIVFDVVFSEGVTGFTDADVVLAWTGTGTPVVSVPPELTPSEYEVVVSGLTGDGVLTATIAAGAALDGDATPSLASTSTDNAVTFDVAEPDVTAPTVTIEQGVAQADPTDTSPIVFDVEFSEPVTGFGPGDVVLSGSANPTTAVVSGTAADYTVEVSGMSADGLVIAEVAAAAAEDAAGNLSEASTSVDNEVTFQVVVTPDPLTITVPDDIVVEVPFGETGENVSFDPPTTTGGVPPVDVDCDHASGDLFPVGVTTVTCTATDSAPAEEVVLFAVVSDSFTITVVEGEDPGEEPPPTDGPGDPGDPGDPGTTPGGGSTSGTPGGMAATGVESTPTLLAGIALLLLGAALARIRARRAAASARD